MYTKLYLQSKDILPKKVSVKQCLFSRPVQLWPPFFWGFKVTRMIKRILKLSYKTCFSAKIYSPGSGSNRTYKAKKQSYICIHMYL